MGWRMARIFVTVRAINHDGDTGIFAWAYLYQSPASASMPPPPRMTLYFYRTRYSDPQYERRWVMLHRAHPEGIVVIGQAAHARLVGVVARAWGRPPFVPPPHMDETLLAAEQHELGMTPWEIAPTLNAATGLPHAYLELSRMEHLALWRDAGPMMRTQSRYAALLVSRHGAWIFSQYERPPDDPAERAAVAAYLRRERTFQTRLRASLAAEPEYREAVRLPAVRLPLSLHDLGSYRRPCLLWRAGSGVGRARRLPMGARADRERFHRPDDYIRRARSLDARSVAVRCGRVALAR